MPDVQDDASSPKTKLILVRTLPIQLKLVRRLPGRRASSSLEQLILTSRNWKMITTMLKTRWKEVLVAAVTVAAMRRIMLSDIVRCINHTKLKTCRLRPHPEEKRKKILSNKNCCYAREDEYTLCPSIQSSNKL